MINEDLIKIGRGPVLITGATGFTGTHLARRLANAGTEVRAIARPGSDRTAFADLPVTWFTGDVATPETIKAAVDGTRYIFNIATLYRSPTASEKDHYRVHVEATQRLAMEATRQPDFRRFIQVSTVGVHGHIEHPPADEQAPFNPGDEYQRTKAEAERWLNDFAPPHALSFSIIRPCAIYGPGDRRLLKLFRMARRRWCPVIGHRPCLYHLIHVGDLVNILLRAAVHPDATGEAFIAGDPEAVPLDQLLQQMARAQDRTTRVIRLPFAPFWVAALACEAVCRPFEISPPLYRRRVKFFLNDRAFDTRKLSRILQVQPEHTLEEGLAETAAWYKTMGWL